MRKGTKWMPKWFTDGSTAIFSYADPKIQTDKESIATLLKDGSMRLETIKNICRGAYPNRQIANPYLSKLILVSVIDTRSHDLTLRVLRYFDNMKIFSSELLCVGMSAAISRKLWEITYDLVLMSESKGYCLDKEAMNSSICLLVHNDRIPEAWKLMQMNIDGKFGIKYNLPVTTYSLLILTAQMIGHRQIAQQLLRSMMITYRHLHSPGDTVPIRTFQSMLLSMLQSCAYNGDFEFAAEIYDMYIRSSGGVDSQSIDNRAFSYMLMCYLRSSDMKNASYHVLIDNIVNHVIQSRMDKSSVAYNLILQLYCQRDDRVCAEAYIASMKATGVYISTHAMMSYDDMIKRVEIKSSSSRTSTIDMKNSVI